MAYPNALKTEDSCSDIRRAGSEAGPDAYIALEAENSRLNRRLKRERRARAEAEAIAEKSTRDLYVRQRLLTVLEAVATATHDCPRVEEELSAALKTLCGFFSWQIGHVYQYKSSSHEFASGGVWFLPQGTGFESFKEKTESEGFAKDFAIRSCALLSGHWIWVENVLSEANYSWALEAEKIGIKSVFALPLVVGQKVVAVMEFFTASATMPNAAELEVLALVGALLGRAVESSETQQTLHAAHDDALAATRAKSEFLANMSHEIRTPMNGILGMAELLMDGKLSANQLESVTIIRDSAEALLAVINDILDLSKIEVGKITLDVEEFDLRNTVEDVANILAHRAFEKGLEFCVLVSPKIPCRLLGAAGRLRQIITNLVGNAIKFTESGEVLVIVTHSEETSQSVSVDIEVIDTGIGVSKDRHAAIFESFTQAEGGTCRIYGGTGLGLTISSQLAALMGGLIQLESELGKGSTFKMTLPLKKVQAKLQPLQTQSTSPATLRGRRILVSTAHPTVGRILSEYLEDFGFQVEMFRDHGSALDAHQDMDKNNPFACAFFDLHAERGLDSDFIHQIKRDLGQSSLPLVLLDRTEPTQDQKQFRELHGIGSLRKPVRKDALIRAALSALGFSAPDARATPSAEASFEGLQILLVEDNETNQKVASRILSRWGCVVTVVDDGIVAVETVKRRTYDVVLMDCQMPGMSGHEATEEIRRFEAESGTPRSLIIAMTANAMIGDREACLTSGMDDYISKPIRPSHLRDVLSHWLGIATQQANIAA